MLFFPDLADRLLYMKLNRLGLATILLFTSMSAFAAPEVIFFGGAQSQQAPMNSCFPRFKNFPYPAQGGVDSMLKQINSPANKDKPYLIAGHSSGAKYANMLASGAVNPSRITLVDLDGYAPRSVPKAVRRICWKATNGRGLWSRNAGSMSSGNNCGEVKTHVASQCSTPWCLHFSLVNLVVPGDLRDSTWITQGYKNCQANGKWAAP